MIKSVINSKWIAIGGPLIINFLISWTILPLAIPPFRMYSFHELMEVLLWQGIGAVGWPLAILGGFVSLIIQGKTADLVLLMMILIYPTILLLLLFVLFSKRSQGWMLILLHLLLSFAFAAIWYQVLNGYNFMIG